MKTTFSSSIALFLLSFLLTACGDIFMKKSESNSSGMSQFATCGTDTKALAHIFTEDVSAELGCLEQNLNLFIDVVKTDRPGNLSLKELRIYIKTNIPELDSSVVEALAGIFDINSLIFGDDREYINKKNVKKLIKLLVDINQALVENHVYEYFMTNEQGKVSFEEHNRRKAKVFGAFTFISNRLNEEFTGKNHVLNFVDFLEKFKNLDNNKVLQNCTDLLYLKRIFLGGDEEVLTSFELKRLAKMLPDIGKVVFDMVHSSDVKYSEHEAEEVIITLKEDAQTIVKNLYYKGQDYTNVMTMDNVFATLQIFFPEYMKYKKYMNEILKLKGALLENSTPIFNSNEVMILAKEILLRNLEKGAFFFRMYAANSDILDRGNMISEDLPGIVYLGGEDENFKSDFNRIIKSYRFFKGQEFASSFNNSVKRNPLGIFEVAVFEDLIKRIMAAYGTSVTGALGGYRFTQRQLENFMGEYKNFLEGEDIVFPGRTKNTAETITLMSSLFQFQSDGDSDIEVNELVEFAVELMSSTSIAEMGNEFFQKQCQSIDDKGRYTPECYRQNFVAMMDVEKDGVKVGDKLGKLNSYLRYQDTDVEEYLKITEVFTRSCTYFADGTEVPMDKSELFLLFSGLMAVEQTMIRYDINDDNVLNPSEVDKAFPVYESAIKALLPDGLKGLAKKVFLYMIKNEKVPGAGQVLGLLVTPQRFLKATATRKTLAIILKALSEESPANKENPFPCELLR